MRSQKSVMTWSWLVLSAIFEVFLIQRETRTEIICSRRKVEEHLKVKGVSLMH